MQYCGARNRETVIRPALSLDPPLILWVAGS
jgi:hypothetical protein